MVVSHIYLDAISLVNLPQSDKQALEQACKLLSQGGLTVSAIICSTSSTDEAVVAAAQTWCAEHGWEITQQYSEAAEQGSTDGSTGAPEQACSAKEVNTIFLTATQHIPGPPPPFHPEQCITWTVAPAPETGIDALNTTSVFFPYQDVKAMLASPALPASRLLQSLTHFQAACDADVLVVGYAMSQKRERELAAASLLNFTPLDSIIFMPLDLSVPLETQPTFHILLHKFSDELQLTDSGRVEYSARVARVISFLSGRPSIRVVDPLANTRTVLDRMTFTAALQKVLIRSTWSSTHFAIPGTFVAESRKDLPDLPSRLQANGLNPPYIVKVAPACGVSGSHAMVLIRSHRAWPVAKVAFPAVIQQYINHAQALYKVYVLGNHVKVTKRKSIPDIQVLGPAEDESAELSELFHEFDSLASLPLGGFPGAIMPTDVNTDSNVNTSSNTVHSTTPSSTAGSASASASASGSGQQLAIGLNMEGVELVAEALRCELGLRLFGFDVVVCQQSATHYIIDVNYFPNYREVKDAGKLLRQTLRDAYEHN